MAILVLRTSRSLLLIKLPKVKPVSTLNVLQGFTDKLLNVAMPLRLDMSYDQHRDIAMDKELSKRTGIAVYFCNPHNPCQRGSSGNINGSVRQTLPKGTDFSV
jgi:IS30 family transposase